MEIRLREWTLNDLNSVLKHSDNKHIRRFMSDGFIVKLAFNRFDIDRIFATPFGTNIASHRVLEKARFALEGRFKKIVIKNGEMLDELIYAIRRK